MKPQLDSLATLLGRPADQLQVLDYRPLALAFVPGSFVTYVVRDRASGETLELTLDVPTGQAVDPSALRQLDQSQGAARGRRLSPELLSLMLRHASLQAVQVGVSFSPAAARVGREHGEASDSQSQEQLAAELRRLAIDLPPQQSGLEPAVKLTLSVPQIAALSASPWVRAIELVGEPEIPDQAD
jgi:hypothetical protein